MNENLYYTIFRIYRKYLSIIIFTIILSTSSAYSRPNKIFINKIKNNNIYYSLYVYSGENSIDISDLYIWDEAEKDEILQYFYNQEKNLRILLLKNGCAKLKNSNNINNAELKAQEYAIYKKIGLWNNYDFSNEESIFTNFSFTKLFIRIKYKLFDLWNLFIQYCLKIIVTLSTIGVLWLFCEKFLKKFYKKFFIERRFKLFIMGEVSSGKTALRNNLLNPNITKNELLDLSPSNKFSSKKRQRHIQIGRFEIFPEIADIPGSDFGGIWDNIIGTSYQGWIFVLSPLRKSGFDENRNKLDDIEFDKKYINIQLGILNAYLRGGLTSKHNRRKPKILILFISKFDLLSEVKPDDSSAKDATKIIQNLFKEHIDNARFAARQANIEFEVFIGSSIEKWNIDQILNFISNKLYGF